MSETFFHLLGPGTQPNDDSFSMNPLPITCQVNGEPSMAALEQCAHSPQVIALLNELQHQLSERQPPLGEVLAVDLLNLNADDRHFINTLLGEGEVSVRIQQADDSESEIQEAIFCGLWRVRRRCGLPDFEDSWALAGGIPSGQKLRKVLHQERSIEFLFEGRRFHDLRRWKEAPEVMNKQPRSWNRDAKTQDDFYQVIQAAQGGRVRVFESPKSYWLAIPLNQINKNPQLVQNPGY